MTGQGVAGPRLLVIGSSGQIAQALTQAAASRGWPLADMGRPFVDLTRTETLDMAVSAAKPDVVINAAAFTSVDGAESDEAGAFALNAEGAGALAEACARHGAPLIHLSTDYVFDGGKGAPYTPGDAPAPLNVYGCSKLAGERAVAKAGGQHIILRTSWVFGPTAQNFAAAMLRLASEQDEVCVVADELSKPTPAMALAEALLDLSGAIADTQNAPWGVYHLGGEGGASRADLAEAIFEASKRLGGASARVARITAAEFPTPAKRPRDTRLDNALTRKRFGVGLPCWREGVEAAVKGLLKTR